MVLLEKIILKKHSLNVNKFELNSDCKHIAFGSDVHYIKSMGVTISSIIMNNPEQRFVFHILIDQINDDDLKKYKDIIQLYPYIQIILYYVDVSVFKKLPMNNLWAYAMYYRFIVPHLLSGIADKVLYLDADILCVNKLEELYKIDFEKNIVLAIQDTYLDNISQRTEALGIKSGNYFNSGFLYIDIKRWCEADISEKAIELLEKDSGKYQFWDQDVLNILLEGKTKFIHSQWNYMYSLCSMEHRCPADTIFIHYITGDKPWRQWTEYHFMAQLYRKYINQSLWSDFQYTKPINYKQFHRMAKSYWKRRMYIQWMHWNFKYMVGKVKHIFRFHQFMEKNNGV